MNRRRFLGSTVWGLAGGSGFGKAKSAISHPSRQGVTAGSAIELSPEHVAAVNRRRRVAQNFDVLLIDPDTYPSVEAIVKSRFTFIDDPDSVIDSAWWNWSEGNVVPYPSKFLPNFNQPGYQKWLEDGVDIVRIFQDETRKRGLEVFFSHRMNGSDNDPQNIPGRGTFIDDMQQQNPIPMKRQHPDWLLSAPWNPNGYWNYAVQGVRDYVLRTLREIAEDYDFDGLELDFARIPIIFPPGEGWEHRAKLTELIRDLRHLTLKVEKRRGRPFLLAARVPENLMGCHFDGLDVETWAREQLLDIFVMGCRNFQVDVRAFRRITEGLPIKLLCALDDHHSSDGYCAPPIEVLRGVWSNWYHQGTDGIQTFNFKYAPDPGALHWPIHQQALREMGGPKDIQFLDKTFVMQRRGGGHGPSVIPNPENWSTPRLMYFNTNMLAPLPAAMDNEGKADTLLTLYVGDDIPAAADRVAKLSLLLLLNDPATIGLAERGKLQPVLVREYIVPKRKGGPGPAPLWTSPPALGTEQLLQVRLNNLPLGLASLNEGWLEYRVKPEQLARGENLLGLRLSGRAPRICERVLVEKVELRATYHRG